MKRLLQNVSFHNKKSLRFVQFVQYCTSARGLSEDDTNQFAKRFEANPTNVLARNVGWKGSPFSLLRNREVDFRSSHIFNHKVESEGKPISDQKQSGRCWIFACLNCMRLPYMKSINVEDFEFSQTYIFFWDKLERFNYELNAFVEVAGRGEEAEGRLFQHLLSNPSEDGGQWHMLVNIVEKYGVIPKKCLPESWSAENTRHFNSIVNNKMREYCMRIIRMVKEKLSDEKIQQEIKLMNEELFRIASICVGTPPKTFTFEYYDKDKNYHVIGPISPRDFYHQHIKPVYNMEDKIVFVNDSRAENPYNKLYTVDCLGNMTDGRLVLYINQDIDTLKKLAMASIDDNQPVWFGCDVGQHFCWKKNSGVCGVEDLEQYDHSAVFGTSLLQMTKAERLQYRESLMTHAMVLTAYNITEEGGMPNKWRVENSWGDTDGDKGYLMMTDSWFDQFVYEVVVDKKFVSDDIMKILSTEPKVLPAWDPMGALAKL